MQKIKMARVAQLMNLAIAIAVVAGGFFLPNMTALPNPFHLQSYTLAGMLVTCVLNIVALKGKSRGIAGMAFVLDLGVTLFEPLYSHNRLGPGMLDWLAMLLILNCVFLWRAYPSIRATS